MAPFKASSEVTRDIASISRGVCRCFKLTLATMKWIPHSSVVD